MALGNIKGIIVEIGGDTSGLQKALKSVYSQTSSLQKELRGINSLLKLDPKNTELLSQKQKVLKETITETKNKLSELKVAQKQYIDQGKDLNTPQYRALQREIIQTTIELKKLGTEASLFTRMGSTLTDLSNKLRTTGTKVQDIGNSISNLGKTASIASSAVAALFTAGVKYNADIEQSTKAFETFLGSAEAAEKAVSAIRKQGASSPFDTKELIKANQMLVTTGVSADDSRRTISALADAVALTGGGNDELTRMASNLQQIKNAGKATSMDIRQFAYAGIDVYGILAETTGKNVAQLKKMDITYDQLSNALIKASSEGGKYYNGQVKMTDTLNGSISKLKKSFQALTGELAEGLMPVVGKITDKLQNLTDSFSGLSAEQKETIVKVGLFVAALGPALIIIGKIVTIVGTLLIGFSKIVAVVGLVATKLGALSGVFTAMTGPLGIIIGVISGLVAIFVQLWNNSESFRNSMIAIGTSMMDTVNTSIIPAVTTIMEALSNFWNDILIPIVDFLQEKLQPVFESVFTVIGNVVSVVFAQLGTVVNTFANVLSGLITFITGVFNGDWQSAWEGISTIFSNIFNGLKSLFITPINWIIDKINDFIWHVNQIKIPEEVPGVGGFGFNIPYLSKIELAKGGIVTQPTNALIGEGKSAEAVIPLDRSLVGYMAEAMKEAGGTGGIVVNFYPQKMTEAELDNAFNYINRRFGLEY